MKTIAIFLPGLLLLAIIGCSSARYLEMTRMGETAFQEKDYQKALETSEEIISDPPKKQYPEPGRIYALAGNSAFALEQYKKSQDYLERARQLNYSNELVCLNLASIYQRIGNLSKEITILETYNQKYSSGTEINYVREKLYQTYWESMNYDLAVSLWPLLDDPARSDLYNLELFLEVNRSLKNDSICDLLAEVIMEQNPENEPALSWIAKKYYWQAENRYQAEMTAYDKNKTHSQYAILLEAFKTVTLDFKESLGYFTRLYELYPNPDYAKYLGNIYVRLNAKQKARYYRSLGQ